MQITSGNNSYGERKIIKRVLQDEYELNARIFQFPSSDVKDLGRTSHYYDFLMFKKSENCNKALMRIVPRIHMEEIQNFLQEVPYLSYLQHTFYQSYNSS